MKNRALSLSLVLSLSMASFSPTLIAVQQANQQSITKSSGFQAAIKKVRGQPLTPAEQAAYNTLKKRVGIAALVAAIGALLGMSAYKVNTLLGQEPGERPRRRPLVLPGEGTPQAPRPALTPEQALDNKKRELAMAQVFLNKASESGNVKLTQYYSQMIQNLDSAIEYIEKQLRPTKPAR